jgi:hypothetical protein
MRSAGETVFIMSCLIPNRKSHPLVHRWFGVSFADGVLKGIEEFDRLLSRTGLGRRTYPNRGGSNGIEELQQLLPKAVREAGRWMELQRREFENRINDKLNEHLEALERLRSRKFEQREIRFQGLQQPEKLFQTRKERERREIDSLFNDYLKWVEDTMTTENHPYIQVVAVLRNISGVKE